MSRVVSFLMGTAEVTANMTPEEFINTCANENIPFGNVKTLDGKTHAEVFLRDAERFKKGKVRGLPEIVRKAKKRLALVLFIPICALIMLSMSFFVWDIDVHGNENVTKTEILKACEKYGLDIGTFALSVNSEKMANKILCEIPELSWFAVNITGSRAHVLVCEEKPMPRFANRDTGKNIRASKAGKIIKATVFSGTLLHKPGESVEKGETLVSPDMELTTEEKYPCAANAEIIAQTEYERDAVCPKECYIKTYTGKAITKHTLMLGKNRIKLFRDGKRENCDKSITVEQLAVFGAPIPVYIETTVLEPYTLTKGEMSDELCVQIVKTELSREMHRSVGAGEITDTDFETDSTKNAVYVTLYASARENIAVLDE